MVRAVVFGGGHDRADQGQLAGALNRAEQLLLGRVVWPASFDVVEGARDVVEEARPRENLGAVGPVC